MNYQYKNTEFNSGPTTGMRKGTLKILIDKENNTTHISDSYDDQGLYTSQLNFKVTLNDIDANADFETLLVEATNDVGNTNTIRADVTIQIQNISQA